MAAGDLDYPSPLKGPGVGVVKKSAHKKIDRARRDLMRGDWASAKKRVGRVDPIPPAQLLSYQILLDTIGLGQKVYRH